MGLGCCKSLNEYLKFNLGNGSPNVAPMYLKQCIFINIWRNCEFAIHIIVIKNMQQIQYIKGGQLKSSGLNLENILAKS